MTSKKTKNRRLKRQYAFGAANATGLILQMAIEYKLTPEQAAQLLGRCAVIFRWEVQQNKFGSPFVTRVVAKGLEDLGIDSMKCATKRIAKRLGKPQLIDSESS